MYSQGEQVVGTTANYFYTRDHLGSTREAVEANGALVTRYDYDPYGQQTTIQEGINTVFGFTGVFLHRQSGLNLTLYRPFSSTLGRWLPRDPIYERAGLNLYDYVGNSPLIRLDTLGMDAQVLYLGPHGVLSVDTSNGHRFIEFGPAPGSFPGGLVTPTKGQVVIYGGNYPLQSLLVPSPSGVMPLSVSQGDQILARAKEIQNEVNQGNYQYLAVNNLYFINNLNPSSRARNCNGFTSDLLDGAQ